MQVVIKQVLLALVHPSGVELRESFQPGDLELLKLCSPLFEAVIPGASLHRLGLVTLVERRIKQRNNTVENGGGLRLIIAIVLGLLDDSVIAAPSRTFKGTGKQAQLFTITLGLDDHAHVAESLEVFVKV